MKLKRRSVKRGRVEIIPMIDTILILLIFFMSFSSLQQAERAIDAKMPVTGKPATGVPATKMPLDIKIHVKNKDEVIVNNAAKFDLVTLQGYMGQFSMIGQEATIVIEADAETQYADVVGALDACALANLTKIAFRPVPTGPAKAATP